MPPLIPPRFLFRYSIPIRYLPPARGKDNRLRTLPAEFRLPDLPAIEGATQTGDLRLAWNEQGLAITLEVVGKQRKVKSNWRSPDTAEGLQVWIDTRNTQSIHRASRFCHHFCLVPVGNPRSPAEPYGVQLPIARAKEETPLAAPREILIASSVTRHGYSLDAWLPASILQGYAPDASPRLGFYYAILDDELGAEYLSVGHEFPIALDPSLWATLELVRS